MIGNGSKLQIGVIVAGCLSMALTIGGCEEEWPTKAPAPEKTDWKQLGAGVQQANKPASTSPAQQAGPSQEAKAQLAWAKVERERFLAVAKKAAQGSPEMEGVVTMFSSCTILVTQHRGTTLLEGGNPPAPECRTTFNILPALETAGAAIDPGGFIVRKLKGKSLAVFYVVDPRLPDLVLGPLMLKQLTSWDWAVQRMNAGQPLSKDLSYELEAKGLINASASLDRLTGGKWSRTLSEVTRSHYRVLPARNGLPEFKVPDDDGIRLLREFWTERPASQRDLFIRSVYHVSMTALHGITSPLEQALIVRHLTQRLEDGTIEPKQAPPPPPGKQSL